MRIIPLQPVPNQTASYLLNEVPHTVTIVTRSDGLYLTLWRDGEYVIHNRALLAYAPIGYGLILADTEGTQDPHYEGLGQRWQLFVDEAQA